LKTTIQKNETSSEPGRLMVCVLASGSKGNAIYISNGRSAVLADAGLSGKEIERRMADAHLSADHLDALIVTHEHSDHIRGVGVMARRYDLPVYMSAGTARAAAPQLGAIKDLRHFETGSCFHIDQLTIHPFATSHDAADPTGFTIGYNGCKIGIATDLGIATAMVKHHLKQCALVVLEANHDADMLTQGPYPWHLKQRIKSRNGHLSNEDSRDLLAEIRHQGLRHVILAHLSEINNTPEKALQAVQTALGNGHGQGDRGDRGDRVQLHVAYQDCCSPVFKLDGQY
jgi:phosphoribosyl 1,2-cyclic phosphodiesterase